MLPPALAKSSNSKEKLGKPLSQNSTDFPIHPTAGSPFQLARALLLLRSNLGNPIHGATSLLARRSHPVKKRIKV
jgi:hypothetical protein